MDTEDWVFKGTKLITNPKSKDWKSRVKVGFSKIQYWRKEEEEKKDKVTKIIKKYICIYEVCFKIGSFLKKGYRL